MHQRMALGGIRVMEHGKCWGYLWNFRLWSEPYVEIEYSEDPNNVRHEVWENEKMQIPENVEIIGARYCDPNNFTKGKDVDVR